MRAQPIEALLGDIAKQRILVAGQGRSDLGPILRFQCLEGGRKEITIFHHDVKALVLYKIANDVVHVLPKDFTIRENTIDCLGDAAQTLSPFLVFECEVTYLCSRSGIANFQLGKDQVFLRMMVRLRVNLKIADNRANNLIVGTVPAVENLQFALEDSKQRLDIAMLLGQALNDHVGDPQSNRLHIVTSKWPWPLR